MAQDAILAQFSYTIYIYVYISHICLKGLSSCNPEPTPASKRQRYAAAGISSTGIGARRRAAGHATTRDSKRPRTSLSEDTASAIAAVDRLRAIRAVESGINHHDPG